LPSATHTGEIIKQFDNARRSNFPDTVGPGKRSGGHKVVGIFPLSFHHSYFPVMTAQLKDVTGGTFDYIIAGGGVS
jgi:hypothetical protein